MTSVFHSVLRAVASILEVPVACILVVFIAFSIYSVGWLIVEFFFDHRHMKASVPELLDQLRSEGASPVKCITESGLLKRQKELLLELPRHPLLTAEMREGLAENLLEAEQSYYDRRIKITDLVSKLAPMCGLLGTLIPLGPGIIALGQGDTVTLSASLLTAFDTTIAGLTAAAVCMVVSTVRRRWYNSYLSDLETVAQCVVETESDK